MWAFSFQDNLHATGMKSRTMDSPDFEYNNRAGELCASNKQRYVQVLVLIWGTSSLENNAFFTPNFIVTYHQVTKSPGAGWLRASQPYLPNACLDNSRFGIPVPQYIVVYLVLYKYYSKSSGSNFPCQSCILLLIGVFRFQCRWQT